MELVRWFYSQPQRLTKAEDKIANINLLVIGSAGNLGDFDVPISAESSGKGEAQSGRVGGQRAGVQVNCKFRD